MAEQKGFRRAPLSFFCLLEELFNDDYPGEEIHDKGDDFLMSLILEEHEKSCRNTEIRRENFVDGIVPQMSDLSFRQHFRLSRPTAQKLVELLRNCPEIPLPSVRGRPTVEIEKQLLLTLWYLGNPECIRSVSDRFDVTRSTVFRVTTRICKALVNHIAPSFIR